MKKIISAVLLFSAFFSPISYAATTELDNRISEADKVLKEIMASPDHSIPEELLAKAKAIAIYPSVLKVGFIIGGRFGKGVVLSRDKDGKWGPVAFSTIGGGSWGLQIGGSATDLVLVVLSDRGMDGILSNSVTLGVDAAVAAGPVGRSSSAGTDLSLQAGIISYSRSRGFFAGMALDGAVMTQDNDSNRLYYGKPLTSRDILLGSGAAIQLSSKELTATLDDYSSRWNRRV